MSDPAARSHQPECTCDPAKLANICRDIRKEPHLAGCPRWGTPLYDNGGVLPPGLTWVRNDSGEDEEVRPA